MPVSVPTNDEFTGAVDTVAGHIADLQGQVESLTARVTALEAGTPPDPIDPPPDTGNGGGGGPGGGGGNGNGMVAVVTLNNGGGTHSFYEANATDVGSFHAPSGRFTMACRRLVVDGCPLRLFFRRIDGWQSIVFELGDVFDAPPPDLQGYSVDILDDLGQHHTVTVGAHFGLCRWRWQSGPWPHVHSLDEMVASHDLPRFDAARAVNAQPLGAAVYQPLGFAGFEPRMPNTGGRGDIGQVTEHQGFALCTDDAGAWASVLSQGEAMNSWPFMMRDMATGAPLDIIAYPQASYYEDNRTDPRLYSSAGVVAANIAIDPHHQPAGSYLPYLRTEDPYYLETLQCQTLRNFCDIPRSTPMCPGSEQVRGTAWSLRTLSQGWHVTPEEVPSWLLPKTILKALLDQAVTTLNSVIAQPGPLREVLHLPDFYLNYTGIESQPRGTAAAVWQDDFAIGSSAWAAVLYPGCADFATYMAHNALDRLAGESGWPPGVPEVYSLQVCDQPDSPIYDSWQKAWQVNAPQNGLDPANPPQELRYTSEAEFDYPNGLLAALAMVEQARSHGVPLPDCRKILDFLCTALEDGAKRVPGASIYWRSAVAH